MPVRGADGAERVAARRRTPVQRRLIALWVALGVLVPLALVTAGFVLYARGGGEVPEWAASLGPQEVSPLGPSSPAEVVLRTLRLAGYQRAVVGERDGTVVVRIEAPKALDPTDVALTWQTGMAAAAVAYPKASRIVVQVFSPKQALIEVGAKGSDVRAAVRADDAAALTRAATVRYLSESGDG